VRIIKRRGSSLEMHCVLPGWKRLGGKRRDDDAAGYRSFENFCISGRM
jgi:hypothetical protein